MTEAVVGEPLKGVRVFINDLEPVAKCMTAYPPWLVTETNRRKGIEILLESGKLLDPEYVPSKAEMRLINKARIRKQNAERAKG